MPYERVSTLEEFAYMLAFGNIIYDLTICANVGANVPVNFEVFNQSDFQKRALEENSPGVQTLWFLVGQKVVDHIIDNFNNEEEQEVVREYLKTNGSFNKHTNN